MTKDQINMKNLPLLLFVCNLASIAAVVGAAYIALNGIAGWGWFLLAALILSKGYRSADGNISD